MEKFKQFIDTYAKAIGSIAGTIILIAGIFFAGMATGCKSLRLFNVKGQPQSCNDMYTQMDWNLQMGQKDTTLITLWNTQCQKDRNYKKKVLLLKYKEDCIRWTFRGKPVNKEDFQSYSYYLECTKKSEKIFSDLVK